MAFFAMVVSDAMRSTVRPGPACGSDAQPNGPARALWSLSLNSVLIAAALLNGLSRTSSRFYASITLMTAPT
ncbi:hypothetical protein D3C80_647920 [compost metagenome]